MLWAEQNEWSRKKRKKKKSDLSDLSIYVFSEVTQGLNSRPTRWDGHWHVQGHGGTIERRWKGCRHMHTCGGLFCCDTTFTPPASLLTVSVGKGSFPMPDRQASRRASKGRSTHTELLQTGVMKTQLSLASRSKEILSPAI